MDPVTQAELAVKLARAEQGLAEAKAEGDPAKLKAAKLHVREVRQDVRSQLAEA